MDINRHAATIAAYTMSRFNTTLGWASAKEAYYRISQLTGVDKSTVKVGMRDVFDFWYPWRVGWRRETNAAKWHWDEELKKVFVECNPLSEEELMRMLRLLGLAKEKEAA